MGMLLFLGLITILFILWNKVIIYKVITNKITKTGYEPINININQYHETSKKKLGNHTNEPSSVIHQRKIGFNIVSALSFSVRRALIIC